MNKNRPFIVLLIILLAIGLSACEQSDKNLPPTGDEGKLPVTEKNTASAIAPLTEKSTPVGEQTSMAKAGETAEATAIPETETIHEGEKTPAADVLTPPTTQPEKAVESVSEQEKESEPKIITAPETTGEKKYNVPDTYTLQKGEFPYCIARRFNITPNALLRTNGLNRNSITHPGMVLTIPGNAEVYDIGTRARLKHPTEYTVRAGDTVYRIACLFGDVDPRAIIETNGLMPPYTLNVGNTLSIPK